MSTLVLELQMKVKFSSFFFYLSCDHRNLDSFPTRRSSDLNAPKARSYGLDRQLEQHDACRSQHQHHDGNGRRHVAQAAGRSEEHTSELQSRGHLVCRLLLEKKKSIEK